MNKLSELKKRGCPTCEGVDARSCFRCRGKTRMCDWYNTEAGWAHYTELDDVERQVADAMLQCAGKMGRKPKMERTRDAWNEGLTSPRKPAYEDKKRAVNGDVG